MKRDADFFDDAEPKLLYIARKLEEAINLEEILTAASLDYGVEADHYRGGIIFQTDRVGAFFYVRPETEAEARALLTAQGFRPAEPTTPTEATN